MDAFASFRYGDGRIGNVHKAAVIPIAIVGCTGQFMAYVVDAEIPALLGKEALETLGAHLNFCRRVLTLEELGADIPLKVSTVGHYLLDVADFPENSPRQLSRDRKFSAMDRRMQKTPLAKNDNLLLIDVTSEIRMHPAGRDGPSLTFSDMEPSTRFGIDLHPGGKGLPSLRMDGDGWEKISNMVRSDDESSLDPRVVCPRDPAIHGALTSTTLGEAVDGEKRDPREIVRKLHVN